MIEFCPECNETGIVAYNAIENGEIIGKCTAECGYEAKIISLKANDDITAEGLMRSILNHCANKGAYIAYVDASLLCPATEKLGFSKDNLSREIPDILTSSCCSCH